MGPRSRPAAAGAGAAPGPGPEDLITYLKEERPGQPVLQEPERLRVA